MKTIGVFQLEQKKYDTIKLPDEFAPTIGCIPKNIHMVIFGDSGNGKTEFVIKLVKGLCIAGLKVDWISYEQGHGMDLQQAIIRNKMKDVSEYFQVSDPDADMEEGHTYFTELEEKVRKRGSADVFVIDSVQYTRFSFDDYKRLKTKYKRKGFLWISHKDGKLPAGTVAKQIAYDGGLTILVRHFIASPIKNRFGGHEAYVVYEERARLLNPKFFKDREENLAKPAKKVVQSAEISDEERGVIAP